MTNFLSRSIAVIAAGMLLVLAAPIVHAQGGDPVEA
ncbi:MAG: hypothetical protein RJA24_456, partial [Pseudomonadota bacterium]